MIKIGSRSIGNGEPVYVIAEAGSNHNQDFDVAKRLVDAAVEAGADAVKFQLFDTRALYRPNHPLFALFKSLELPRAWVPRLMEHCRRRKICFLATPFDLGSVDLLHRAGVPAFKWGSSETTNLPLLRHAALKRKPLLISTGMCDLADVAEAVEITRRAGNDQIVLLQCTSVYPSRPEQAHLNVLDTYRQAFGVPVGFSDHTLTDTAALVSVAKSACVIEKHLTLSRRMKGPDHACSQEPQEFRALVTRIREAESCMGSPQKTFLEEERKVGRRDGVYAARGLRSGEKLTPQNTSVGRPAVGISSRYAAVTRSARLGRAIAKGEPVRWSDLSKS